MINSYQIIGLYGVKYRSKKKTERKGETHPLPSRVFLARPFHFSAQMTFMCLLRRLPRCHYFVLLSGLCYGTDCSVLFWLSFTGAVLVSGNDQESRVSSTGCTKNQWLQCSCRLMGPLQKYFYSRLLQT